jgi:hypothetical protein
MEPDSQIKLLTRISVLFKEPLPRQHARAAIIKNRYRHTPNGGEMRAHSHSRSLAASSAGEGTSATKGCTPTLSGGKTVQVVTHGLLTEVVGGDRRRDLYSHRDFV